MNESLSDPLHIRLLPSTIDRLRAMAAKEDRTLSAFVRRYLERLAAVETPKGKER